MILRPYQESAVEALRRSFAQGYRAPLLQLPTGGGKTLIFVTIAVRANAKGKRVLVVAHRRELIRQAVAKLADAGVTAGTIAPGFPPTDHLVQVGSIQTLANRLDRLVLFDLMVFDEAHHSVAGQWRALIASQPGAKLLGVTATPQRLDGKGLGVEAGGVFDDLVIGPSVADLIAGGFLVPSKCFVPAQRLELQHVPILAGDYRLAALEKMIDRPSITGDAVVQYRHRADHAPAICFCVSVAHADHVAQTFRDAGYRAVCAHGRMSPADRDRAIAGLATAQVEVLTSCDLISEGLDVPNITSVILLRPTKSLALHLQQIGRGLRPAPGKDALTVLDHAGNLLEHGLPETPREWSLDGTPKDQDRNTDRERSPIWRCECGRANSTDDPECVDCGEPKPAGRTIVRLDGALAALTADAFSYARGWTFREMASAARSEAELREFARARDYHPRWVRHRLREQAQRLGAQR